MKLYLAHDDPRHVYTFLYPDQSVGSLLGLRLVAFADIRQHITNPRHRPHAIQKCIVDTGAHLSIIPSRIAQYIDRGTVTRLPFHPSVPPGLRVLTIAGIAVPYELAELGMRLVDKDGQFLDIRLIAKSTQDGGRLPDQIVLGLRGGFLESRALTASPDPAVPHSQGWMLVGP